MVKLKGPGLSAAARGSIGDSLTFSSSKGRAYLKKKPTPKQPRTGKQVSMRAMLAFLSQQWTNLLVSEQESWANAYPDPQLNNYNAYLRHNLERWRSRRPPTKAYPATEEGNPAAVLNLNATGGVRHVELNIKASMAAQDNWFVFVYHSATASPNADFDKMIHCELVEDLDSHCWTHSPLLPGTHYYRIRSATDDGKPTGYLEATASAVVT